MQTEALAQQILNLPRQERSHILERLIASLDDDPEIEELWLKEATRRNDEADRDPSILIPAEEVFARLHAKFS
jgi:putative addiction module component (TIGR02574 family)